MGTLPTHVQLPAPQDPPHPLMLISFPLVGPKTFPSAQSYFSLGEAHVISFC